MPAGSYHADRVEEPEYDPGYKKVASIEEFKNKKYRYQMTEYSVEIERLVIRLENLFIEGASLEPTLLERIRRSVEHFPDTAGKDKNEVYTHGGQI